MVISFFSRWKISLKIGERTSGAAKYNRMLNEIESGETFKYVSGPKIDLIVETTSVHPKNLPITIELSSTEFKMKTTISLYVMQQNKNIRTSKSILASIFTLNYVQPVISLKFVGLSGCQFSVKYSNGAVFNTREAGIYLHGDTVDLDEFTGRCEEVSPIIFAYRNYIVKQAEAIDKKRRELQRQRLNASAEGNREHLPPTFYSPKR